MTEQERAIRERLDDPIDVMLSGWDYAQALRAVMDLHVPEPLRAGLFPEKFGEGRCAFCKLGEPERVFEGELSYRRGETIIMHDHANPEPWCASCGSDTEDDRTYTDWPCPTVRAIARALGVTEVAS